MEVDAAYQEDVDIEDQHLSDAAAADDEGFEDDPKRLIARQKQIDFGKNTIGYERYLQAVPKDRRKKYGKDHDPPTPDITKKMSKKNWDGIVKAWRRHLHKYDDAVTPAAAAPTSNGATQPDTEADRTSPFGAAPPSSMQGSGRTARGGDGSNKGHGKWSRRRGPQQQQQLESEAAASQHSSRVAADKQRSNLRLPEQQQHEQFQHQLREPSASIGHQSISLLPAINEDDQQGWGSARLSGSMQAGASSRDRPGRERGSRHRSDRSRRYSHIRDNLLDKRGWGRPYGWDAKHQGGRQDRSSRGERPPAGRHSGPSSSGAEGGRQGRQEPGDVRNAGSAAERGGLWDDGSRRGGPQRGRERPRSNLSNKENTTSMSVEQQQYQHDKEWQQQEQEPRSATRASIPPRPLSAAGDSMAAKQGEADEYARSDGELDSRCRGSRARQITPAKRSSSQGLQQLDMRPLKL